MLAIPFKAGQATDLVEPLLSFFRREYSEAAAAENKSDCDGIQKIREDAIAINSPSDEARETLLSYQAQIMQIEQRLPLADGPTFNFSWKDAFLKGKSISQNTLAYERACVLFNLGSLESAVAAGGERRSDDGVKLACKHFQCAAGYFELLREIVPTQLVGTLTPDLSTAGLGLAVCLMLGQAQV